MRRTDRCAGSRRAARHSSGRRRCGTRRVRTGCHPRADNTRPRGVVRAWRDKGLLVSRHGATAYSRDADPAAGLPSGSARRLRHGNCSGGREATFSSQCVRAPGRSWARGAQELKVGGSVLCRRLATALTVVLRDLVATQSRDENRARRERNFRFPGGGTPLGPLQAIRRSLQRPARRGAGSGAGWRGKTIEDRRNGANCLAA
jgi:hypothetical protein